MHGVGVPFNCNYRIYVSYFFVYDLLGIKKILCRNFLDDERREQESMALEISADRNSLWGTVVSDYGSR